MDAPGHFKAKLVNIGRILGLNRRERERNWAEVAAARGGELRPEVRRVFGWKPPRIDATVGDVAVHVDLNVVSTGNSQHTYTRFRCRYLLPGGPDFKVYPAGLVGTLGTALGFEDVELGGDEEFDHRFVVRTADPDACRRAWTPTAKLLMRSALAKATVVARRGLVTMQLLNIVYARETLDAGIDLLAEVGGHGRGWLEALRSLPGGEWHPPTGPWDDRTTPAVRLVPSGVAVWLFPVASAAGLEAVASAEVGRDLPPFELAVDRSGTLAAEPPPDLLGATGAGLLPRVAPARLSSDGRQVRVALSGDPNPARLEGAAELAAALTIGPSERGTYR